MKPAHTWEDAEATTRLDEVIDRALSNGPQTFTRNRRPAVVVAEEWERKTTRKGNLAEFFADSPLRGAKIELKRIRDLPREPEPWSSSG